MNDRIKLAKMIGWKWQTCSTSLDHVEGWNGGQWSAPDGELLLDIVGCKVPPPFDPFTDANDDYVVLEWARNQNKEFFSDFCDALFEIHSELFRDWKSHQRCHAWNYTLGDNARAALKVLP